mmetsp:Transcript_27416/g.87139  ORF Transcript_27416/g.87139 Transcript_27416/m.87139 type:complete len:326 (-) Transcript_27416:363-1340(-)
MAMTSALPLRRSCLITDPGAPPAQYVLQNSLNSASRSQVPADSTEKARRLVYGTLTHSTFLPVKPCTSISSARFVVSTAMSRPDLKAMTACSSSCSTRLSPWSFWSTSLASTARASSPTQLRKASTAPGGDVCMTSAGTGTLEGRSPPPATRRHLADRYLWMAIRSTLSFRKSISIYALRGSGGLSPNFCTSLMSVQTIISESLSTHEPAERTPKHCTVVQGILTYFTFLPDQPLRSTSSSLLVVKAVMSRRPLNAISTRSEGCKIGVSDLYCRSTAAASIMLQSLPTHARKLLEPPPPACPAPGAACDDISTSSCPRSLSVMYF